MRWNRKSIMQFWTMCVLVLAVTAFVSGCGGDKKKAAADTDTTRLAGRVDLFSGFGLRTDRAGLAARIRKDALVKVYELADDGNTVKAVPGVSAASLDSSGTFTLTNMPSNKTNLIIRVDASDGTPILAAILPVTPSAKSVSDFLITPETDIETQVFMKVIRKGIRTPGDVKPAKFDTLFIKRFVTADAALDADAATQPDKASDRLATAVRAGYGAFLITATNKSASPEDVTLTSILAASRASRMSDQLRYEESILQSAPPDADVAAASKKTANKLSTVFLSDNAALAAAWETGMTRAADCLKGRKILPECTAQPVFDSLADSIAAELSLTSDADDTALRAESFLPEIATGAEGFLPPAIIIARYANVEPARLGEYRKTLDSIADAMSPASDPDAGSVREAQDIIRSLATTYITRTLGMNENILNDVTGAWGNPLHDFAAVLSDSDSPASDRDAAAGRFYKTVSDGAKPIRQFVEQKYDKLPVADRRLLAEAITQLFAASTLNSVPLAALTSKDKDGDGVPDNIEVALETNPDDDDSRPTMPSPSTPLALLTGMKKTADQPLPKMPCLGNNCSSEGKPTVAVSGKVEGSGNDTQVGLFAMLSFRDKKPLYVATAAADGGFRIDARPGRYYVVAWRDAAKSGSPSEGDRAGWYGGPRPTRVDVRSDVKLRESVTLFARVGRPGCAQNQVIDPVTGACASDCPAGLKRDVSSQSCSCPEGRFFNAGLKSCESACPDGSHSDSDGICVCADGARMDSKTGACACPEGMKLDAKAASCGCLSGYLNRETMTCADSCMDTYVSNDAEKTCECPAGASRASDGLCRCEGGVLNTMNGSCVAQCPDGSEEDPAHGLCRCAMGSVPNPKTGNCECPKGYRTGKGGACKPNCPEGFVIGTDDSCARPEHNNSLIPAPAATGILPAGATPTVPPLPPFGGFFGSGTQKFMLPK